MPSSDTARSIPRTIAQLYAWTVETGNGRSQTSPGFRQVVQALNLAMPPARVVKIAGTNGKGSVGAMLEAMALAGGLRVGLFTSPHLRRITERFRCNGTEVAATVLDDIIETLGPNLIQMVNKYGDHLALSFFAYLTIVALDLFTRVSPVDLLILEAGIGGYSDIVHLIPAETAAITSIGLDHTEQLGPTLADIAADKVGIASPQSWLILGPNLPTSALGAIQADATQRDIQIVHADPAEFVAQSLGWNGHQVSHWDGQDQRTVHLPLVGAVQLENLATATAIAQHLVAQQMLPTLDCLQGLAQTSWPGRMEYIPGPPAWVLDVAHNPPALERLTAELPPLMAGQTCVLVVGLSDHGLTANVVPALVTLSDTLNCPLYLTDGFHRSRPPDHYRSSLLQAGCTVHILGDYRRTLDILRVQYRHQSHVTIVVTGSLFLVGQCREYLLALSAIPPLPI